MKRLSPRRTGAFFLAVLLCLSAVLCTAGEVFSATPGRFCYTTTRCKFRSEPTIQSGNELISSTFNFGLYQVLPVLGEVSGSSYDGSTLWYKVSYTDRYSGKDYTGYVHSKLVHLCSPIPASTSSFSDFPVSYRPYLAALSAAHPNWKFTALKTGKDWKRAVAEQNNVSWGNGEPTSNSFISKSYAAAYRSQAVVNGINVSTRATDGGSMYCASEATIAYFMDPRNFLNEVDVFMFSNLAYDAGVHTLPGIENMLKGTYMETLTTPNEDGAQVSYAQAFLDAAKQTGISPYYLVITSLTENGSEGTNLSKGNLTGGVCANAGCADASHRGYYNFYGIGSTPGGSPQHNGLLYAKEHGWNTAYKAITEGASFQADNYINRGQQTPYLKKFNVNPASPNGVWHQYMQNLTHPEGEALKLFQKALDTGTMETCTFLVPVYTGMPDSPCTLPGSAEPQHTEEGGSTGKVSFSTSFRTDSSYLWGLNTGMSAGTLKSGCKLGEGTTMTVSTDTVGTGTVIRVSYGGEVCYKYSAVVFGDLSGNGKIEALDLLYLRDYLLGTKSLSGAYLKAADVDHSGSAVALDLLKLRDAMLGSFSISQKG